MRVVATAGHVDHGKSTLVRALTGTDPDRFAEEKARGMTIDLGFAWTTLKSGERVAFVDVPGHVRFLRNMLAGVGAVEACLFVLAAPEGWKPQSEEHLRILQLVGIGHGLVALTKVGLVDEETRELAHLDLADHLGGTFLERAEVIDVDSVSGAGIEDLRHALDRLVAAAPAALDRGRPRLWIDRVFAARGSGTVVTGTLAGGSLRVDDELAALPGGRKMRVRGLQSLHQSLESVGPGNRVAVNLTGASSDDLGRGHALVRLDQWHPSRTFDATLEVLASLDHPVSRRGAYQAYIGSAELPARLRLLGAESLKPGGRGLVRVHLPADEPLLPGDRFVLRESGRDETVGGGEVLDVAPVLPASRARPDASVDRVVAERGWVSADELERLTGTWRKPTVERWVVAPESLKSTIDQVRAAVETAGHLGLDLAALGDRQRAVLSGLDGVTVDGGRARLATAGDPLADHPYVAALEASPFAPPDPAGIDRGELRELVRRGTVIEREGCYFAASVLSEADRRLRLLLGEFPDGVTVAQVRDAFATTRKHVLPLLGYLDSIGVTRRRGDLRVGGPKIGRTDEVAG